LDSATFALGFVRYGCREETHRLAEGLVAASELFVARGCAPSPARVLLVDSHLPEWLPDVRPEGVRVGDAVVDLEGSSGRSGDMTRGRGSVRVNRTRRS
jgi:hypothetical protein